MSLRYGVGGVCVRGGGGAGASLCRFHGPASSLTPSSASSSSQLLLGFSVASPLWLAQDHPGCAGPPNVVLSAESPRLTSVLSAASRPHAQERRSMAHLVCASLLLSPAADHWAVWQTCAP